MADGLVVGTRFEQMKAVEGWAIECFQESAKNSPNNEKIIENLRKINLQVRKLWVRDAKVDERTIRGSNLSAIPTKNIREGISSSWVSGGIPDNLTQKITQIRAAAVVILRDIKKDKLLSNSSKRNIRVLSSLATDVIKIWAKGKGKVF